MIGGHGTLRAALGAGARRFDQDGVALLEVDDVIVLERHGLDDFTPAHRIDHARNLAALAALDCRHVLGLSSVGSLRLDWPVGSVVVPDDFYAPLVTPSRFADERGHRVPGFDARFRRLVIDTWRHATSTPVRDGGVYAQTTGPRFETPVEVRALAQVADLVGMTAASECVLTPEFGLSYASVCVIDNLGNGLEVDRLTLERYRVGVAENSERLAGDLRAVVAGLSSAPE